MNDRLVVRITAPFAVMTVLIVVIGGFGAWYVNWLHRNSSAVLVLNVACVRAARELEVGMHEVQTQLIQFLRSGDPRFLDSVNPQLEAMKPWLDDAKSKHSSEEQAVLFKRVEAGFEAFRTRFNTIYPTSAGPGLIAQIQDLSDESVPNQVLQPTREFLDVSEQVLIDTSARNRDLTDRTVLALLLMAISGAGMGLIAGIGVARAVSQSIVQLNVPIRDVAGKLNEVVGPLTLSTGGNPEDMQLEMQRVATEIGTVVERLQQSQREVARAEQLAALGVLAAGLAHELRNPLTAMRILVQSAEDLNGELRGRDLAILEEEITRLEASIQTFLDFARPPRLETRRFDLRPVVQQTIDVVSPRANQQGVDLRSVIPTRSVEVDGDMHQLRQVLLNLVLNALDAIVGEGRVSIEVHDPRLTPVAAAPPDPRHSSLWVTVSVADSGPGLPPQIAERIFEPFVSSKEAGLGLGLSICKRIVEAHGGQIEAMNQPGGGALFTVRLPRHNGA